MQNFTLGKRELSMLFFAFILLIGSSPTFGQCPVPQDDDATTTGNQQDFCALSTVFMLQVSDLDGVAPSELRWYDTATPSTNEDEIPSNEILENGKIYYAGNSDKSCLSRQGVTAIVTDAGPPVLSPGEDEFFTPCQRAAGNPDNNDIGTLKAGVEFNNVVGFSIEYYADEFGQNSPILPDNFELVSGTSYFAGLVGDTPTDCQTSSRTAIRYEPVVVPAPTADPEQTVCFGTTVGELEASGTNRWYRTATSEPPLPNGTVLEDGKVYFATQIIPSDGPPCESKERTRVGVIVQQPVDLGTPTEGIICESDVAETFPSVNAIENFYLGLLAEGTPTNGTFNPTPAELADIYQADEDGLGSFMTVYTVGVDGCESSVELTATIVAEEDANAGTIEDILVECGNEDIIILDDSILSEDATTGGTFTGEGLNEDGNFDPAIGPGTYTITYSVDDNADCVTEGTSDSTTFNITVQGSELGEPIVMEMCITEVQDLTTEEAIAIYTAALAERGITNPENGNFSPTLDIVAGQIAGYLESPSPSQTFETTYSQSNECGDDSVLISLTINDTTAPEAGDITPAPVCASATLFDLNTLLGDNNDAGGTFSNEDGDVIVDGLFDVSVSDSYDITYRVTESDENCTAGEPNATEFTLTVNEGTVAESPDAAIVCETDVDAIFSSFDEIRKFYTAIAQQAGFPTGGKFDPSPRDLADIYQDDEDGLGNFTTTYTFGGDDCQTSVELTVEIVAAEVATLEPIESDSVCVSEDGLDLSTYLSGNTMGGTFTSSNGTITGSTLDVSEDGVFDITYTVDESDPTTCLTENASEDFTITVSGSLLGEPIVLERCIIEIESFLIDPSEAIALYNDALAERGITDLTGTFTPDLNAVGAQIIAYLANPTPTQTFETTYSVSTDCGEDSVSISLTVNDTTAPDAGDITPEPVCSSATLFDLNTFLGSNNDKGGTFSIENVDIEDGLFDVSVSDSYDITYTVTESDENCTAGDPDSTEFTLTVNEGTVAESPDAAIVCETDVDAIFSSFDEIRKFYTAIAQQAGFPTGGNFDPSPRALAEIYQDDEDGLGNFTTTYTFGGDDCQTSVELTVEIVPTEEATLEPIESDSVCVSEDGLDLSTYVSNNTMGGTFTSGNGTITGSTLDVSEDGVFDITYTVDESDPSTCLTGNASEDFTITVGGNANAGADNSIEVCNVDVRDLSNGGVRNLFLDLLEPDVSRDGTFDPTIQEIINQYQMLSNFGDFETEYTVEDGGCSDSVMLTVTVLEANDAGDDRELDFCSTEDAVNLYDFLSPFATTTGTFVGYEDGMFDPATATIGVTSIEYQVEEDESVCSTGNFSSIFEITVSEPEAANAGENNSEEYCVELNEDILLSTLLTAGANPGGSFEAPFEDGIFNPSVVGEGVYKIDYMVDEDDCVTGTATITLTITVTATAPTPVADAEQSFCLIDNPTVGDIVVTGDNVVIYTDAALGDDDVADPTTPLANNAVYYAVATGDNGCNSEAVTITITLTDGTAPTLQMEGDEFCRSDNPTIQDLVNNLIGSGIQIYQSSTGGTALATTTALQDGVTYFASGTDSDGCESSERLGVQVEVAFCGIPEAFSPNGDNINDRFVIPDIAIDFPNYTIEIFNRWGNVVFKGNSSTGDWDGVSNQSGTLGDKVLPAGVYFYILNYNDGQTATIQGKVYLSR